MLVDLDLTKLEDYRLFLRVKSLPRFSFTGRTAEFPDEYAKSLGIRHLAKSKRSTYKPHAQLFDYQAGVAKLAIAKKKFAAFMGCGMGKTLVMLEFAAHAKQSLPKKKSVLMVSPLMVIRQTVAEAERFYGDRLPVQQLRANELGAWMQDGLGVGITNYEAITDLLPSNHNVGALILDESSMLKSHYGKWGTRLIELGKGLEWKLCLTGTPAPNDRIEYANHAVFLDHFPTVNAFLARFFINRGQTDNRWELKQHALRPFYRSLSHWCIFLNDPATYGWKDNCGVLPPVNIHIEHIDLAAAQHDAAQRESGCLFAMAGGITSRAKLSQIAKGRYQGEDIPSLKPEWIKNKINESKDPSIIWCKFNQEQDALAGLLPFAANISGSTPAEKRLDWITEYQNGYRNCLISKPKIMGFGLNLHMCQRMIFSTLQDSYEEYHQAVKRANRYGSRHPLDVWIPVTEIELPMIDTVLRKARMVESDTREQEAIFREVFGNAA